MTSKHERGKMKVTTLGALMLLSFITPCFAATEFDIAQRVSFEFKEKGSNVIRFQTELETTGELIFITSSYQGNVDLYVGKNVLNTMADAQFFSENDGSFENVRIPNAEPGIWYVMLVNVKSAPTYTGILESSFRSRRYLENAIRLHPRPLELENPERFLLKKDEVIQYTAKLLPGMEIVEINIEADNPVAIAFRTGIPFVNEDGFIPCLNAKDKKHRIRLEEEYEQYKGETNLNIVILNQDFMPAKAKINFTVSADLVRVGRVLPQPNLPKITDDGLSENQVKLEENKALFIGIWSGESPDQFINTYEDYFHGPIRLSQFNPEKTQALIIVGPQITVEELQKLIKEYHWEGDFCYDSTGDIIALYGINYVDAFYVDNDGILISTEKQAVKEFNAVALRPLQDRAEKLPEGQMEVTEIRMSLDVDERVFILNIPAGKRVTIYTQDRENEENVDTILQLYDADGNFLQENDDIRGADDLNEEDGENGYLSRISFTAEDQSYYVRVSIFRSEESCFDLKIEIEGE